MNLLKNYFENQICFQQYYDKKCIYIDVDFTLLFVLTYCRKATFRFKVGNTITHFIL